MYQNHLRLTLLVLVALALAACAEQQPVDASSENHTDEDSTTSVHSDTVTVTEHTSGVIYRANASDADGDTITYSISGGVDSPQFSIGGVNGELSFLNSPDYENPRDSDGDNVYEIQLSVSDGISSVSLDLSVIVVRDNQAPTASISIDPEPSTTILTTDTEITLDASASSDPDGDDLSYTWSQPSEQNISLSSATDPSTKFTAAAAGIYTFTLIVSDGAQAAGHMLLLEIVSASSAPAFTSADSVQIAENLAGVVYTATTSSTETPSYSIVGGSDKSLFTLSGPELSFIAAPDYENPGDSDAGNTYEVQLRATAANGLYADLNLSLSVADVNEAPKASASIGFYPETNTPTIENQVTLDGLASSDPESASLSYAWAQPSEQGIDLSSTSDPSVSFTTNNPGTYSFTLIVSDGELEDSVETIVTINAPNLLNDFKAAAGDGQVSLTWTPYSSSTQYNIYRSTDPNCHSENHSATCSNIESLLVSDVVPGHIDTGLTNATTYYYWLEASLYSIAQRSLISISATPWQRIPLNDTGIGWSGDDAYDNDCNSSIDAPQDCNQGRDLTHDDGSDGRAGFSFTKLDSQGYALAASATDWSCVLDNTTGLIWENKTDDSGLHNKDNQYNWYSTDSSSNGGFAGYADNDGAICDGYDSSEPTTYCNTEAFVERVNSVGLCGSKDWRLPDLDELRSIVDYGNHNPSIDTNYFPNNLSAPYWSASASLSAEDTKKSWLLYFSYGFDYATDRNNAYRARLVRFNK